MANLKFLDKTRVIASEIISDTRTWLSRVYGKSANMFTKASPFAQIIQVVEEIGELLMSYIEDSTVEQNVYTAQQPESIYGLARLNGHDPTRGFAATGEIQFKWKPGADLTQIAGDGINISNYSQIKINENGKKYTIIGDKETIRLKKSNRNAINVTIVQGSVDTQTLTGTGEALQSYNVKMNGLTDHNMVNITVNSEPWHKFESLYDMNKEDKGFIVKTGIGGGLDIYFGNGNFGAIPPEGSEIQVEYIEHDGVAGNIGGDVGNISIKWESEGTDSLGESYDLNEYLETKTISSPKMGANEESTDFTKILTPLASKSFVLSTPESFEYFLSRYNLFSYLDAYNKTSNQYIDDDNVIYIFAVPDINQRLLSGQDYFDLDEDKIYFSDNEYDAMRKVLGESGQLMLGTEINFPRPQIKRYMIDISVRYFEGFKKEDIFNNIRAIISEHLLNITRRDKLPKSDIIYLLEKEIEGIDAVNVQFISEQEEKIRRQGYYESTTVNVKPQDPVKSKEVGGGKQKFVFFERVENTKIIQIEQGDPLPDEKIGLDKWGDIIMEKEEIAVFRGGWQDRDGNVIPDEPRINEAGSLSVNFDDEPVPRKIYSKIQEGNRKK